MQDFLSFWAASIKFICSFLIYVYKHYTKNIPTNLVYVLSATICTTIFDSLDPLIKSQLLYQLS